MGKFKIIKKLKVDEIAIGTELPESDYATVVGESFIQMEYQSTEIKKTKAMPGIYSVNSRNNQLVLEHTEFSKAEILTDFNNTTMVTKEIDRFFNKLDIYRKYRKNETPRRAILLYGVQGSGKTSSLIQACNNYVPQNDTLALIWPSSKFEAYQMKDFIKSLEYDDQIKKMIFIIEDLGGVEYGGQDIASDSELLSLLDNAEKIFTIPTFTIATTNFPHVFAENITNRPGRFDVKMEVGHPTADQRVKLFKFFSQDEMSDETEKFLRDKKCDELTPAHLKEIVIRAAINDITHVEATKSIIKEIDDVKKEFKKHKQSIGLRGYD